MIAHPIPIPAAAPGVSPFEMGGGREVDAAMEVVIAEPEEVLGVVEAELELIRNTVVAVGVDDNELDAAALDAVLTGIGVAVI
jgi:hypothetical protein